MSLDLEDNFSCLLFFSFDLVVVRLELEDDFHNLCNYLHLFIAIIGNLKSETL